MDLVFVIYCVNVIFLPVEITNRSNFDRQQKPGSTEHLSCPHTENMISP